MATDRRNPTLRTTRRMGSAPQPQPQPRPDDWDSTTQRVPPPKFERDHAATQPRGIEVEYVLEPVDRATGTIDSTMVEVWTRNRIYRIDSTLTCTEVVARASGQREPPAKVVGARLAGGEHRLGKGDKMNMHFYFPLPVPGSEAVFCDARRKHERVARTSTVERVVLRLHKVRISEELSAMPWDEVTGRFEPRK